MRETPCRGRHPHRDWRGGDNSWKKTENGNPRPKRWRYTRGSRTAARKPTATTYPLHQLSDSVRSDGYTISGNRLLISGEVWNTPPGGTNTIALILDGDASVRNSSGRLNLLSANSHAGPNSIEAGVLHAGHSNAFGEFNALVDAVGGVVSLAGGLTIFNPLIIGSPESPFPGHGTAT